MDAALVVDLDLSVQPVPLVKPVSVLVAPALAASTTHLDQAIEKAGIGSRYTGQCSRASYAGSLSRQL